MKYVLMAILSGASSIAFAASTMPVLNLRAILWDLFVLLGVGVVLGIAYALVGAAPFINDMFKKILQFSIIFVGAIILIYLILGWIGM